MMAMTDDVNSYALYILVCIDHLGKNETFLHK